MKYTKEKFKFMNNLPVISLMGLSRKSEIANYILELREENHKMYEALKELMQPKSDGSTYFSIQNRVRKLLKEIES